MTIFIQQPTIVSSIEMYGNGVDVAPSLVPERFGSTSVPMPYSIVDIGNGVSEPEGLPIMSDVPVVELVEGFAF